MRVRMCLCVRLERDGVCRTNVRVLLACACVVCTFRAGERHVEPAALCSGGSTGGGNGGGSVATSSPLVQQQAERQPNFSKPPKHRIPCTPHPYTRSSPPADNIAHVKVELPSPSPTSATSSPSPPSSQPPAVATAPLTLTPSSLLTQMNALGPTDRCTPSQAQAMGQQVLAVIALHEKNTLQLPCE